jgi:hypothetical protein
MGVRGSVAIVGAAESDIGAVAALMSPIDLMAQASTAPWPTLA